MGRRLIDADPLFRLFNEWRKEILDDADGNEEEVAALDDCIEVINDAPTIIPSQIVRIGSWVHGEYHIAHCSECGYVPLQLTPFCGNCGADMREGDDDEEHDSA